jgi:hypothetical protein
MVAIAAANMILDHLETELTQMLMTDITDDTKVTELRPGKLQDDPTKDKGLNVLIYAMNADIPSFVHKERDGAKGLDAPTTEIGGGWYYNHPFALRFNLHFRGENDRAVARTKALVIFSRARWALQQMRMPMHPTTGMPTDDFNETIIEVQMDKFWLDEGGGPGHFIWRGWMYFNYLCEQTARDFDTYYD